MTTATLGDRLTGCRAKQFPATLDRVAPGKSHAGIWTCAPSNRTVRRSVLPEREKPAAKVQMSGESIGFGAVRVDCRWGEG